MKVLLLSLLFIVIACNSSETDQGPGAQVLPATPEPVTVADVNKLRSICRAVSDKATRLSGMVNNTYNFSYAVKTCTDNQLSAASDVAVTLKPVVNGFEFKPQGDVSFLFVNPENAVVGNLGVLCAALNSTQELNSPLVTGNGVALYFGTSGTEEYCKEDTDNLCLEMYVGLEAEGGYRISSKEWIKFRINGARTGFFTERTMTIPDCEDGNEKIFQAFLK